MDPLAEAYHSFSPYNYVTNNPINSIDPDGRYKLSFSGEQAQDLFRQMQESGMFSSGEKQTQNNDSVNSSSEVQVTTNIGPSTSNENNIEDCPLCPFAIPWVIQAVEALFVAAAVTATVVLAHDILEEVLEGAELAPDQPKSSTEIWEKPGDLNTANEDFDSLNPENVRDIDGVGRVGKLPNGETAIVRERSRDGRPTLEVKTDKSKRRTKIRYEN